MRHFLSIVVALLVCLSLGTTANAEKTVILVVHQGMSDAEQKAAIEAGKDLMLGCDVGDSVQFHNASTLRRIASFTIPESPSQRARLVALRRELAALQADLELPRADGGTGTLQPANIPALLTSLRTDGKSTRIVVVSSLYFNDGSAASFSHGHYLSDGWILGTSRESAFGTSDLKGLLSGVFIDWVCTDAAIDTLERRTLIRFWSVWASELGATLTSVENTASVAVENALKGRTNPVTTQTIDRTDTVMEIRSLSKPAPTPALDKPVTHEVELVFAQDGSGSMLPAIESTKRLMSMTAELGARLTPRFALGAVVYRNSAGFSIFSPTRIERTPAGSVQSAGVVSLRGFMEDATFDAGVVEGASGENASGKTGAGKMVSQMTPLASHVDFEGGVRAGLAMLEQGNPTARKVLMIVGDMGTSESDGAAGTSAEDAAAADRTIEMTRAFVQRYPDTRILMVYCGAPGTPDRTDTIALFKRLAALAGEHGVFTEDIASMEPLVTQAMLKP